MPSRPFRQWHSNWTSCWGKKKRCSDFATIQARLCSRSASWKSHLINLRLLEIALKSISHRHSNPLIAGTGPFPCLSITGSATSQLLSCSKITSPMAESLSTDESWNLKKKNVWNGSKLSEIEKTLSCGVMSRLKVRRRWWCSSDSQYSISWSRLARLRPGLYIHKCVRKVLWRSKWMTALMRDRVRTQQTTRGKAWSSQKDQPSTQAPL